jgi:hypothetical protein
MSWNNKEEIKQHARYNSEDLRRLETSSYLNNINGTTVKTSDALKLQAT